MRRRKPALPKWKYAFSCLNCQNVQFIKNDAKGREGDYCVKAVKRADAGLPCNPTDESDCFQYGHEDQCQYRGSKPEGVAVELADAVIRIADLCGYLGIDLDAVISEKMAYNETRPFKHGKRF